MKPAARLFLLAGFLWLAGGWSVVAALDFGSPANFFNTLAPRLLANSFGVPANVTGGTNLLASNPDGSLRFNIQIYPVNYYTPAVHRLLQLTANLYDATTNSTDLTGGLTATNIEPRFPHVFRPVFGRFGPANMTNQSVYITNYVEEVNPQNDVLNPNTVIHEITDARPSNNYPNSILNVQPNDNVYEIPLIIGARKGLPSFNQFAMQNAVTATRRLQFVRGNWPAFVITQTNVMYDLSVSNALATQAWNSYSNTYPRSLQMTAVADLEVVLTGTNSTSGNSVMLYSNDFASGYVTNIPASVWAGYPANRINTAAQIAASFIVPLFTNNLYGGSLLTNCTYLQNTPALTNLSPTFEVVQANGASAFPIPRWWLQQNTRVRYFLLDTNITPNRIIDYVSLGHVENPVDVTFQLQGGRLQVPQFGVGDTSANAEWATNRYQNLNQNANVPTIGILNQLAANLGAISVSGADWVFDMQGSYANDVSAAMTFFQDNYNYIPGFNAPPPDLTNIFYAPFDPTRSVVQKIAWQVNDPLVHYLVADLVNTNSISDPAFSLNQTAPYSPAEVPPLSGMTNVNARYQPWGGNPNNPGRSNDSNIAVKDPLITRSDDWQFSTNLSPGISWIGGVHRGSPWQTLYLKPALGTNMLSTFTNWAGDCVITDLFTVPWDATGIANAQSNGWLLFLSSNALPRVCVDGALSVPTNDWQVAALLDFLLNTNNPQQLVSVNDPDTNAWQAALDGMQVPTPSGTVVITSNSPAAAYIASGIQAMRSTNYNGAFHWLGDILATPQLSVSSPCLGTNVNVGSGTIVNDVMLESISLQLLPLLRPDSFATVEGGAGQVQFSGMDGYAYATQTSSNFVNWTPVATNYPFNGVFNFNDPAPAPDHRFYRSLLLP